MKRLKLIALIKNGACVAVIGLMLFAFSSLSANAQQPPSERCIAVTKAEYDAAKRQKMLQVRFGTYVRTGRIFRRYYWYCHR